MQHKTALSYAEAAAFMEMIKGTVGVALSMAVPQGGDVPEKMQVAFDMAIEALKEKAEQETLYAARLR